MSGIRGGAHLLAIALFAALLAATPARAELVLSQLIVDFQPGNKLRDDVEIWNDSSDRSFVSIEPREIIDPSLPSQGVRRDPDPEKLGLLVSPTRMILEPGERKLIRIAVLSSDPGREHVYRVTVKPVAGPIQSDDSGLKLLVGYDLLVLVRPSQPIPRISGVRTGRTLTFSNSGNVSVEIVDGRQCSSGGSHCVDLPGKRLYPGASWSVQLPSDLPAEYSLKSPGKTDRRAY